MGSSAYNSFEQALRAYGTTGDVRDRRMALSGARALVAEVESGELSILPEGVTATMVRAELAQLLLDDAVSLRDEAVWREAAHLAEQVLADVPLATALGLDIVELSIECLVAGVGIRGEKTGLPEAASLANNALNVVQRTSPGLVPKAQALLARTLLGIYFADPAIIGALPRILFRAESMAAAAVKASATRERVVLLARLRRELFSRSGDVSYLDSAVRIMERVAEMSDLAPVDKDEYWCTLAAFLLERYLILPDHLQASEPADYGRALQLLAQIDTSRTSERSRVILYSTAARAAFQRGNRDGDGRLLRQSCSFSAKALESAGSNAFDRELIEAHLAATEWYLGVLEADQGGADRALARLVALAESGISEYARAQVSTTIAEVRLAQADAAGVSSVAGPVALSALRDAVQLTSNSFPASALRTAVKWAQWAERHRDWEAALEGVEVGLTALARLLAAQRTRREQEMWLYASRILPQIAAHAHLERNEVHAAVERLERGRLLLSDLLAGHRAPDPVAEAGPPRRPTASRVSLDPPPSTIACYLFHRPGGAWALLLGQEQKQVQVVALPGVNSSVLAERAQALRVDHHERVTPPVTASDRAAWSSAIDRLRRWLGSHVLAPIVQELTDTPARFVIIPCGYFAFLPVHAAGLSSGHAVPEAWSDVPITYALSMRSLRQAWASASGRTAMSILAVGVKSSSRFLDLQRADREAADVYRAMGERGVLLNEGAACKEDVLRWLRDHDLVHFACHGESNYVYPADTALYLEHDTPLTVSELRATSLEGVQLVVMSACESGAIGGALPDEAIGLPAACIEAGAVAALGTFFSVADTAAEEFVNHLYDQLGAGVPTASAYWRSLTTATSASSGEARVDTAGFGYFGW